MTTTATITPLLSGRAVLDMDGSKKPFDSWEQAVAHARRAGHRPEVLPFPMSALVTSAPDVLTVSPVLRVLT